MLDFLESSLPLGCLAAFAIGGLLATTIVPLSGWAFRRWRSAERDLWDCRQALAEARAECHREIGELRDRHDRELSQLRSEMEQLNAKLLAFELADHRRSED